MKKDEFNSLLDKIHCSDEFKKDMEERLTSDFTEAHEYIEVVSDVEVEPKRNIRSFGATAAIAAAALLIIGGMYYGITHMPKGDSDDYIAASVTTETVPMTESTSAVSDENDVIGELRNEVWLSGKTDKVSIIYTTSDEEDGKKFFAENADITALRESILGAEWQKSDIFVYKNYYTIGNVLINDSGMMKYGDNVYWTSMSKYTTKIKAYLIRTFSTTCKYYDYIPGRIYEIYGDKMFYGELNQEIAYSEHYGSKLCSEIGDKMQFQSGISRLLDKICTVNWEKFNGYDDENEDFIKYNFRGFSISIYSKYLNNNLILSFDNGEKYTTDSDSAYQIWYIAGELRKVNSSKDYLLRALPNLLGFSIINTEIEVEADIIDSDYDNNKNNYIHFKGSGKLEIENTSDGSYRASLEGTAGEKTVSVEMDVDKSEKKYTDAYGQAHDSRFTQIIGDSRKEYITDYDFMHGGPWMYCTETLPDGSTRQLTTEDAISVNNPRCFNYFEMLGQIYWSVLSVQDDAIMDAASAVFMENVSPEEKQKYGYNYAWSYNDYLERNIECRLSLIGNYVTAFTKKIDGRVVYSFWMKNTETNGNDTEFHGIY
jgi:hypothetical protein